MTGREASNVPKISAIYLVLSFFALKGFTNLEFLSFAVLYLSKAVNDVASKVNPKYSIF